MHACMYIPHIISCIHIYIYMYTYTNTTCTPYPAICKAPKLNLASWFPCSAACEKNFIASA